MFQMLRRDPLAAIGNGEYNTLFSINFSLNLLEGNIYIATLRSMSDSVADKVIDDLFHSNRIGLNLRHFIRDVILKLNALFPGLQRPLRNPGVNKFSNV